MKIVVDTSILIDFSRTGTGSFKGLIKGVKENKFELYASTVSMVEFWAGRSMENKTKVKEAENIFSRIILVSLDEKISKKAGGLIRKQQTFGFDAIIATTALEIGAQVATSNTKHFYKIKGLKLYS
ncbi:MAG: nucleic acid-binding protein [uncultured bacterium]|nr:MAG: nucleic acid-binding protein [uncultured bacterium]